MTPWPVLIWIQTHPGDNWKVSPHGNELLFAVGKEAMVVWATTSAVGLALIIVGCVIWACKTRKPQQDGSQMLPWFVIWVINAYALFSYIMGAAVAYA